jgi:hypothetical protein
MHFFVCRPACGGTQPYPNIIAALVGVSSKSWPARIGASAQCLTRQHRIKWGRLCTPDHSWKISDRSIYAGA